MGIRCPAKPEAFTRSGLFLLGSADRGAGPGDGCLEAFHVLAQEVGLKGGQIVLRRTERLFRRERIGHQDSTPRLALGVRAMRFQQGGDPGFLLLHLEVERGDGLLDFGEFRGLPVVPATGGLVGACGPLLGLFGGAQLSSSRTAHSSAPARRMSPSARS